jgi:hypothetical protein
MSYDRVGVHLGECRQEVGVSEAKVGSSQGRKWVCLRQKVCV